MMLRNFQKEYCLGKAKLNNRTHSYSECTIPIEIDKKQKSHRFFNQWLFYSLYRGDKIVCAFLWFPFAGVQSFIQKHVRKRTNSFCFSSFSHTQVSSRRAKNKKATDFSISGFSTHFVGVTRFELATTRPPDAYSNRAELHPEFLRWSVSDSFRGAKIQTIWFFTTFEAKIYCEKCYICLLSDFFTQKFFH